MVKHLLKTSIRRSASPSEVKNLPLPEDIWKTRNGASEFLKYSWPDRKECHDYLGDASLRLALTAELLSDYSDKLEGPILDISSDRGILFPLLDSILPNGASQFFTSEFTDDCQVSLQSLKNYIFHCEKDVFPEKSKSFGLILFCEIIEHLMFDPVWAIVQLNRITRDNGYIVLTTPNAGAITRITDIFKNRTAAGFVPYKPINPHLRHFREYSASECEALLDSLGFQTVAMYTGIQHFRGRRWNLLLKTLKILGILEAPYQYYGDWICCLAQKRQHVESVSELNDERRWPSWLYSKNLEEHARPREFPVFPYSPE